MKWVCSSLRYNSSNRAKHPKQMNLGTHIGRLSRLHSLWEPETALHPVFDWSSPICWQRDLRRQLLTANFAEHLRILSRILTIVSQVLVAKAETNLIVYNWHKEDQEFWQFKTQLKLLWMGLWPHKWPRYIRKYEDNINKWLLALKHGPFLSMTENRVRKYVCRLFSYHLDHYFHRWFYSYKK